MKSTQLITIGLVLVLFAVSGQVVSAQEEYTEHCTAFWNTWASGDIDASVKLATTPFLYCDGKSVSEYKNEKELSTQLKSMRDSSEIGATISVDVIRELSFKELPIDSFRLTNDNKTKLLAFFQDDDVAMYVTLKDIDGEKRDQFALIVRWTKGAPVVVGVLD